jgi:VanZ family protein
MQVTDSLGNDNTPNRAKSPRFFSLWGPVIVWMIVIFFLSAQSQFPTPDSRLLDLLAEKTAHTVEYAILAALLVRALRPNQAVPWRVLGLAVLVAGIYALTDELHQKHVPGRSADWMDIAFDWLGAAIGAACVLACIGPIKQKLGKSAKEL